MNERIKELAKNDLVRCEYTEFGWQECHYYQFEPTDLEKFAELIVKECADWINDNVGLIDEEAKADLLKHFGTRKNNEKPK